MKVIDVYRKPGPGIQDHEARKIERNIPIEVAQHLISIETEYCFNVELKVCTDPHKQEYRRKVLAWLIQETFEPGMVRGEPYLSAGDLTSKEVVVEVGPRLAFSTAWCSNCLAILEACGVTDVTRIERSRRHKFTFHNPIASDQSVLAMITNAAFDRMTECVYETPLQTFTAGVAPEQVKVMSVLSAGRSALEAFNQERGLGLDNCDVEYYTHMFADVLRRDPTDVELFDIGQSNSEHSRHWFFGSKVTINDVPQGKTLFQMVKSTLSEEARENSVIAFHDNSSAIRGFEADVLLPANPTQASAVKVDARLRHPILTAETHNFPTGVAPFAGAETGTGGRLRDIQATGRGAYTLAGVCGYCVGNLHLPGQVLPGEQPLLRASEAADARASREQRPVEYPTNLASPLRIMVEASNGASDYGNKYGEPVVAGFARSFGLQVPAYSAQPNARMRVEWLKPIMFTAGVGWLEDAHTAKVAPEAGMLVCKMGGPAYRIGMGGGAASSRVQGPGGEQGQSQDPASQLDFDAVQRGDAEMENRMNRLVRACVELGERNPMLSIHDQGAGGNGNVLKEIVDPLGARIQIRAIPSGDPTLSVLELWGAEYQENNAFLAHSEGFELIRKIAERENCPVAAVGTVTGDGSVVVEDEDGQTPFNLPLSLVLGNMPQKELHFFSPTLNLRPLQLPRDVTAFGALMRVLRLLDVGSKRFLTNKVDRSVTGLVAQQQCVGPLHTPLADVAVLAESHFSTTGVAVAVGEQPIKGLLNPAAQARMTVAEALSNLVFADITCLGDVKASCNWMWPAKVTEPAGLADHGAVNVEGARMYQACSAIKDALLQLGVAIDGGKDSLTMAAKVGNEVVRAPGEVTLTCYAPCRDITHTVTPDLKHPGKGILLYVDLGEGHYRLGGTALSTAYHQLGNECPDLSSTALDTLRRCWTCLQHSLRQGWLQAGHDRSDGGMIATVLEMAFAGNAGVAVRLHESWLQHTEESVQKSSSFVSPALSLAFGEESGFVLEVLPEHVEFVMETFNAADVPATELGHVTADGMVRIDYAHDNGDVDLLVHASVAHLRDVWEATSFALEMRQCDAKCVEQEAVGLRERTGPPSVLTFTPEPSAVSIDRPLLDRRHKVAVLRQEGTNGDREMLAAFHTVGFQAWDVNMRDLLTGQLELSAFRGVVFCGGFSYADVHDSAKGWAAVIRFNPHLLEQFTAFRQRSDTFSLGVCNGCQLMALLGWVSFEDGRIASSVRAAAGQVAGTEKDTTASAAELGRVIAPEETPRFVHNTSGRFESRWCALKVLPSSAVLLRGMAGSTLGVWVAHGEGRAYFPNHAHLEAALARDLAPLRYVDDRNECTDRYPMNPNGSPQGIAALCSENGRHLAIMPHPERSFLKWQIPYMRLEDRDTWRAAPWLRLFQNAWSFCEEIPQGESK